MTDFTLSLSETAYEELWDHLLPEAHEAEQAAFAYAVNVPREGAIQCRVVDWDPVGPDDFVFQSAYHIELRDEVRGKVIKRAHDLAASLIELHSHIGPYAPRFSYSDRYGFEDFVPHVMWRLKDRPYAALVVAERGWDGFVWMEGPRSPQRIKNLATETGKVSFPSRLSPLDLGDYGRYDKPDEI